jgi:hypothetical protein
LKAGSPHGPGARDPGDASIASSIDGFIYPVAYDSFVDHRGHRELTHSFEAA